MSEATPVKLEESFSRRICWICGNIDGLEEHHIVPRAYGGSKGPTVILCGLCHANIDLLSNKKELFEPDVEKEFVVRTISGFCYVWKKPAHKNTLVAISRAYYLASIIRKSRQSHKSSPNRRMTLSQVLDPKTARRFRKLCKTFNLTQKQMIYFLINQLYEREVGSE